MRGLDALEPYITDLMDGLLSAVSIFMLILFCPFWLIGRLLRIEKERKFKEKSEAYKKQLFKSLS